MFKNHLLLFGLLLYLNQVQKVKACTAPDKAGSIQGKTTICYGELVSYKVPAIDSAVSYIWTLPAGATIVYGANTDSISVRFNAGSGMVKVQGVNACDTGISSSLSIVVNALPKITLIGSKNYCCDFGNISLGGSSFGSPTGGDWSCPGNPKVINSNVFLTSDACSGFAETFTLYYQYTDPVTTCQNVESTKFKIGPLPTLVTKRSTFCQSEKEVRLKRVVLAPISLNSMASASWRILKSLPKPHGGGMNNTNDLIYDMDPSFNFDFWLKVDTAFIDLRTNTVDSLILEITIQDGFGCYNKDTVTVLIQKTPEVSYESFKDICINSGKNSLSALCKLNLKGGCWNVINQTGYGDSTTLKQGLISCDSINTFLLSPQRGAGLYKMRYTHTIGACFVGIDTTLRIYPLPHARISLNQNSNNYRYCAIDSSVKLLATPSGGIWSTTITNGLQGDFFYPAKVKATDRDQWISLYYHYTDNISGCDTLKSLMVFVQSKPTVKILNAEIDTCMSKVMDIKLEADYQFTKKISWVHSADPGTTSFENNTQLSNNNPTILTVKPKGDAKLFILVTVFTEAEGVCPFADDFLKIQIDTNKCKEAGLPFIKSLNSFDVRIAPNPNTGRFSLQILQAGNFTMILYSVLGKMIISQKIQGFENNSFDLELNPGLYFVQIEDKMGRLSQKRILVE